MTHTPEIVRQPAGHAITGHPRALSVLVGREDWPWRDDFAPLDAPCNLPQGSHEAWANTTMNHIYVGFTVSRDGTY